MTETKSVSVEISLPSTIEIKLKLPELEKVNNLIKEGYVVTNVSTSEFCKEPHCIVFALTKYEHFPLIYTG